MLVLAAPAAPRPPTYGAAPGPIADRLIAAFDDDDGAEFDELAQALLGAGRTDALDLAIRKLGLRDGEDAADALTGELLTMAAVGAFGPSGWAELVALPVALPLDDVPDAALIGESFSKSGIPDATVEVRFLPGWRSPYALDDLSPGAIRRVLLDLVAGVEPRDLPPGDTDDLTEHGFGVMLGLQIDWDIPIWDEIVADGLPDALADDEQDAADQPERRCCPNAGARRCSMRTRAAFRWLWFRPRTSPPKSRRSWRRPANRPAASTRSGNSSR